MPQAPDLRSLRSLDQGENAEFSSKREGLAEMGERNRVHLEARKAAFEAVLSCSGELRELARRGRLLDELEPPALERMLGQFKRRVNPSDVLARRARVAPLARANEARSGGGRGRGELGGNPHARRGLRD